MIEKLIVEKFGIESEQVVKEIKEVMLGWLNKNPDLTETELLNKFGEEYGGKGFWVWEESRGIFNITLTEPIQKSNGDITTKPFELPYEIETEEIKLGNWKEWWKAIEHPEIYSAVMRSKLARSIFHRAGEVLAELEKIPGFKEVKMELDSYNDLSGTIEWRDLKPEYIL